MFKLLIMMVMSVIATEKDPATDQILNFKERTLGPIGKLTLSSGAAVSYTQASRTLNTRMINNPFFMETITHLNRERIPERVLHAKGAGAFGYFEVTHDISHICKADFLNRIGKKTPIAVRFSTSAGEKGSSDLLRDVRGFAIKFYTKEGNLDIPAVNVPMYFYKDPIHFPTFVHALKKNPATNLFDPIKTWDAITLIPESLHTFLLIYAGRGISASYGEMPGFGVHSYQVDNIYGDIHFLRFHILPDAGIKNLKAKEAMELSAKDPDYLTRHLFNSIGKGDYPSWTVSVQIISESEAKNCKYDVFDPTITVPLNDFPLHQIGKIVLNKNPKNFHADIEQMAFCPSNLVDGIYGGPDKLYESRRLAYRDSQLYRLGANFNKIPVNCPFQVKTYTYNRDGVSPVNDNEGDAPNYYPNSFNGPVPYKPMHSSSLIEIVEGDPDNFDQAAELYENELTTDERVELISNFVVGLKDSPTFVIERALKIFSTIHPDLGNRVAQGLNQTTCY